MPSLTHSTPILFPDLEKVLCDSLRVALAKRGEPYAQQVYVSNRVPTDRRTRMVIVRRDGGFRQGEVLDRARVGISCWADTPGNANALGLLVRALLGACADGKPVVSVEEQSAPSLVPDESEQPYTYGTYTITTRGRSL